VDGGIDMLEKSKKMGLNLKIILRFKISFVYSGINKEIKVIN
jgi:hypothetical protein